MEVHAKDFVIPKHEGIFCKGDCGAMWSHDIYDLICILTPSIRKWKN